MKKKILKIKSGTVGILLGVIAGIILCLCGCGADEASDAEQTRVVETIDGQDSLSANADGNEAATDSDDSEDKTGEEVPVQESRNVEMISETKDYLEYMSDDEIRELAVEALTAKGLDTSLAEGTLVTKGIEFELPENFQASEEQEGLYITKRYPIDASNILYLELDVDYTLQMMEQDYFENLVRSAFLSGMETDVDVEITEFTKTDISGVPAFRVKAEYDYEDDHITHLMYVINGSQTYVLIYTMTQDYDRMEEFEQSAETINVIK